MKSNCVVFILSDTEYLDLCFDLSLAELLPCDDILISFHGEKTIRLYYNFSDQAIRVFAILLKKCLNNALPLDKTIIQDLGYMWNEDLQETSLFSEASPPTTELWIGQRYLLWTSSSVNSDYVTTWLYNNKNGEIILEITPTYPWHFRDPDPDEKFISYEEFMKSYKPCLTRIIPQPVAQRWLAQALQLEQILDEANSGKRENAVEC